MSLDFKAIHLLMVEPEPTQSVVRIQVTYPDDPKTYSFAALKASGKWYVTGRHGAIGRSWKSLIDVVTRNNATIASAQLATTLEDLL